MGCCAPYYYPEDRSVSESIKVGLKLVDLVDKVK